MDRILVTGANGFIGSHVSKWLSLLGYNVIGLYRTTTKQPDYDSCNYVYYGDLRSPDLFKHFSQSIDAVVHCAATSPWRGISNNDIIQDNILGMMNLIHHTIRRRFGYNKFIFCSSLSLYGKIKDRSVDENTLINNPDIYGATKIIGERLLQDLPIPTLSIRLPGVIGRGSKRNWLSTVAEKIKNNETVTIFNPNCHFNNAVYIDDLCRLIANALQAKWEGHDSIVIGAAGFTTPRKAVTRLAAAMEKGVAIKVDQTPKDFFTISSVKAIDKWRYAPMTIEETITKYGSSLKSSIRTRE